MSRKKSPYLSLRAAAAVVISGAFIAACASSGSNAGGSSAPKTITIVDIDPVTGVQGSDGVVEQPALRYTLNWINTHGGIPGLPNAKFKLVTFDNQSSTTVDKTVATEAVNLHPSLIIEQSGSSYTLVTGSVANAAQIPFLSTGAQSEDIAKIGSYVYSTVGLADSVAQSDLGVLASLKGPSGQKVKTLVLLHTNEAYGDSYAQSIQGAISKFGIKLIDNISYDPTSSDFSAQAARVASEHPDAVIVAGFAADTALIIKQIAATNFHPLAIHGATGVLATTFEKGVGGVSVADGVFGEGLTTKPNLSGLPSNLVSEYKAFSAGFVKAVPTSGLIYEIPSYFTYMNFFKRIFSAAKGFSPAQVQSALKGVTLTHAEGDLFPYTLKFGPNGVVVGADYSEDQFQNGSWTTVWPTGIAADKPVFPLPSSWGQ
jgi:branched-chain amino acid transport system substrate-binding protein